jgi:hypothetical protein
MTAAAVPANNLGGAKQVMTLLSDTEQLAVG